MRNSPLNFICDDEGNLVDLVISSGTAIETEPNPLEIELVRIFKEYKMFHAENAKLREVIERAISVMDEEPAREWLEEVLKGVQ